MDSADYLKPIPVPSKETKPFWDAARAKKLAMPRCTSCGTFRFPVSRHCRACGKEGHEWVEVSGRGTVFSFVTYHRHYHPGFAGELPYVVGLIELEEGPRIISNIVGIAPEDIRCDMKVAVRFEQITPDMALPKFAPVR
jgi:uncharacterized OB-fold protein